MSMTAAPPVQVAPVSKRPPINYFETCPVDCMIDIFRYLDTKCQKRLRRVCSIWKDVLEQPCLARKIRIKDQVLERLNGLSTPGRLIPLMNVIRRNTATLMIEGTRTGDPSFQRIAAVLGEASFFPNGLETIAFVGGSVSCQTLVKLLSREINVVLKNAVIHSLVANREVVGGFHVYMHDVKLLGGPFEDGVSREEQVMEKLWAAIDKRLADPEVKPAREIAFYHLHRRSDEEIRDAKHAEYFLRKFQPEYAEKINTPGTSFYLHYFRPRILLEQLLIAVRDGRNYCCPFVRCCPRIENTEKQRNWLLSSQSESAYKEYEKISRYRSGLIVYESIDAGTGTRCLYAT